MSKKRTSDAPPLRMMITSKGLSPVTAFDAERISSYPLKSEVWVTITQDHNSRLLRKYWAVLKKVIDTCPTPWKNVKQASSALKLALGITENFKGTDGKWRFETKSLTELDGPEFDKFYQDAMTILHTMTGVDPLLLEAESPQADVPSMAKAEDAPVDVATLEPEAEQRDEKSPEQIAALVKECAQKLWGVANTRELDVVARREVLEVVVKNWKNSIPTRHETLRNLMVATDNFIRGKTTMVFAKALISSLANITEGDLK